MKPGERKELIERNSEEVIGDIEEVLKIKKPVVYCGYEPSGEIHLGHLVTITKLLDLMKAGFHIKVLFADWHAFLNRKGEWGFIEKQVESWKKGFKAAGLKEAEFIVGTSYQRTSDYIDDVMAIAQIATLNRALRSMQMVGRDMEHAKVSQIIYPLMQITDIKHLKVDLVQAGIDQRKIHMLGMEVLPKIGYKLPVFVHTPLIPSLQGPGSKMSSSVPESMISIRDKPEEIKKKIAKAHCPEGIAEENPILAIAKLIVFPGIDKLVIKRLDKYGGNLEIKSYEKLEELFRDKKMHPLDLKNAVAEELCRIIEPIRKEFF